MELNERERLAVAQAFYKAAGAMVSTKEPGNLREAADAYYKALYEETGAKSFDVKVRDMKVGTYSVRVSKAEPARMQRRFRVSDPAAVLLWADGFGDQELMRKYMQQSASEFAEWYFHETGELPDGCNVVEVGTPAMPEQYAGGSLRVEPQRVAEALGARLPEAMDLLLERGADE